MQCENAFGSFSFSSLGPGKVHSETGFQLSGKVRLRFLCLGKARLDTHYGLRGGIVTWLLADPSTKCCKDDTLLDAIALLHRRILLVP